MAGTFEESFMEEDLFMEETEDDFHYEGRPIPQYIQRTHVCSQVRFGNKEWSTQLIKNEKCPVCGYIQE